MKKEVVFAKEKPKEAGNEILEAGKLYTITPDIMYTSIVQPWRLMSRFTGKKPAKEKLSKERLYTMLANCLVYYPNELERMFNLEVQEPYDYEVTHYAKNLVQAINNILQRDGEISQEQIDQVKNEIYSSYTYSMPQKILYGELGNVQPYVDYLMNAGEKINITKQDLETVSEAIRRTPNSSYYRKTYHKCEDNVVWNGGYVSITGRAFEIAATIPFVYEKGNKERTLRYIIYIDHLIDSKLSLKDLEESYFNIDLSVAIYLSSLVSYSNLATHVFIDFVDPYGNAFQVVLSPDSKKKLINDGSCIIRDTLDRIERILPSYGPSACIDIRFKTGAMTM